MTPRAPFEHALVVGGCGAVGTLFAEALAASGARRVTILDVAGLPERGARHDRLMDDIRRPNAGTLELLATCDLVILATPETVAIDALPALSPAMRADALLVDTLSVKSPYALALADTNSRCELLGVNPMFAPSLGFAGRSVVAVTYRCGERAGSFLEFLAAQGSQIVTLDAADHDRACAVLQVATHASVIAFGMALLAAGYDIGRMEPLMPPPHRTMLALLARILAADPEVYRDIQVANPYAAQARADLMESLRRLDGVVAQDDPETFRQLAESLRRLLRGGTTDYAELCARLFAVDHLDRTR